MADVISRDDAVKSLAAQADVIGHLAQDSGAFAAALAAFEAKDADAFRWVLNRVDLLPYCELICEWVRTKLGVLRCFELCGVPQSGVQVPDLPQFARAVVQLASNETLLRRVVDAVACGNGDDYRAAIAELKLTDFCYLICHWVYFIIYRRVCEVICSSERVRLADPVSEVRAASNSVAEILKSEQAFSVISKAAVNLDCITIRDAINGAGLQQHCEIICWLICVWRGAWVCREFCEIRTPVLTGADAIEEARGFALAIRPFASAPRGLTDLVTAVMDRDAKAYAEIVDRWGLRIYCWQVCRWVSWAICRVFCICICPPPALRPWFTTVGNFDIYTQIDPALGKTNTALVPTINMPWGGGPNFAFFDELQLGGFCPSFSPTSPGVPMRYRFLYSKDRTTLAAATTAAQTTITVAGGSPPPVPFNISVCVDGQSGETMTVTAVAANTWTVTRGQDGTLAAAASAGAEVWIDPKPITGPLAGTELVVGQRIINWPQNNGGVAGPLVSTFEPLVVGYGTDPVQPIFLAPYVGPKHYIAPDITTGWIEVDTANISGGFQNLIHFDTTQVVAGGCPPLPAPSATPCFNDLSNPGGAPAGSAVTGAGQGAGTDLAIIFQATRVGVASIDYSNSLCKIHINNWVEVNNLWIQEFNGPATCCTPIDTTLTVQFTVDHEEMDSGGWSLSITSCSGSAPGNITPTVSSGGPPPVTVGPRGGSGSIIEDTSGWTNCSYIVSLVTRPGLTTGLFDRRGEDNQKTFCICGHEQPPAAAVEVKAKKR
ncbi:MAG TPA: hypothetical protein VG675_21670 [Bryobacteraceae bacterium]|nr:hypothetical protein [Bryobacteraceae bacterium]